MSFRFTPEDFKDLDVDCFTVCDVFARRANHILDIFVKTLPEVFGRAKYRDQGILWSDYKEDGDTHRARLWGVEEIKPEKCEHESIRKFDSSEGMPEFIGYAGVCYKCQKKLEPTGWREADEED